MSKVKGDAHSPIVFSGRYPIPCHASCCKEVTKQICPHCLEKPTSNEQAVFQKPIKNGQLEIDIE